MSDSSATTPTAAEAQDEIYEENSAESSDDGDYNPIDDLLLEFKEEAPLLNNLPHKNAVIVPMSGDMLSKYARKANKINGAPVMMLVGMKTRLNNTFAPLYAYTQVLKAGVETKCITIAGGVPEEVVAESIMEQLNFEPAFSGVNNAHGVSLLAKYYFYKHGVTVPGMLKGFSDAGVERLRKVAREFRQNASQKTASKPMSSANVQHTIRKTEQRSHVGPRFTPINGDDQTSHSLGNVDTPNTSTQVAATMAPGMGVSSSTPARNNTSGRLSDAIKDKVAGSAGQIPQATTQELLAPEVPSMHTIQATDNNLNAQFFLDNFKTAWAHTNRQQIRHEEQIANICNDEKELNAKREEQKEKVAAAEAALKAMKQEQEVMNATAQKLQTEKLFHDQEKVKMHHKKNGYVNALPPPLREFVLIGHHLGANNQMRSNEGNANKRRKTDDSSK